MKKNVVKLNENALKQIIRESVKRILEEGGHIYGYDEDGNVFTNSKETYRGVPGTTYIWHGEWSDPEVVYQGEELNANDIEDMLWANFREETGSDDEDKFEEWLDEQGPDYIKGELDNMVCSLNEEKSIEASSYIPSRNEASQTFMMGFKSGKQVKSKLYVRKDEYGEVAIELYMYFPEEKEWEPEHEYRFNVEEYMNGTWLPYWESLGGDGTMKSLARLWPRAKKLLMKIGYLADEDDEVPFRYDGDF